VFGGETPSSESLWARAVQLAKQLHAEPEQRALAREAFGRLQARLDQDAEEFAYERMALKRAGTTADLQRLAGLSMQHSLELFESALTSLQKLVETHTVLA